MDDEEELTESERAQFRALAWRWFATTRAPAPDTELPEGQEIDAVDLLDAAPAERPEGDAGGGAASGAVPATASSEVARRHLKGLLEALVFASDKPMPEAELAKQASADKKLVKELLRELTTEYDGRGFRLMEVASGWAFRTSAIYASFVRDLAAKKPIRMSRAQTETLAIVAYRQPVTRPEVDDVRGVDSGAALKALLERDLVKVLGKRDEPGRPLIYGTTPQFLEFFGLKTLADLPTLREFTELSDESKRIFEREMGEEAPEDVAAVVQESFAGGEGRVEGEVVDPEAPLPDGQDETSDDDDDSDDDESDDDDEDDSDDDDEDESDDDDSDEDDSDDDNEDESDDDDSDEDDSDDDDDDEDESDDDDDDESDDGGDLEGDEDGSEEGADDEGDRDEADASSEEDVRSEAAGNDRNAVEPGTDDVPDDAPEAPVDESSVEAPHRVTDDDDDDDDDDSDDEDDDDSDEDDEDDEDDDGSDDEADEEPAK